MAMRTNIVLDDKLMEEAFKFSQAISTKKELIETALKEYVNNRKRLYLLHNDNDYTNMAKVITERRFQNVKF
jgi:Arc/MetJ family transcription regulator